MTRFYLASVGALALVLVVLLAIYLLTPPVPTTLGGPVDPCLGLYGDIPSCPSPSP